MITQSLDTTPAVEELQLSLIRRASIAQRMSRVRSLSASVISLSRRAIKRAHPELNETELKLKIVACHYGEELANRIRDYMKTTHEQP